MLGDDVLVIVLAGGAGERLAPLTRERAKPAVYFGGPYRIIDFVLSNCINSGLRHIFIATQYKSLSLNRHIRQGWTRRLGGARRVHRDPAAAEARRRALVSRHRRRGLPEPLLDHSREPAIRRRARGRSRLQDGLPEDAPLPPGHGGGGHAGGDRSADRRRHALRHRRGRRGPSASPASWRSRRIRRRCPGSRHWRSRRWASTCSTATC